MARPVKPGITRGARASLLYGSAAKYQVPITLYGFPPAKLMPVEYRATADCNLRRGQD